MNIEGRKKGYLNLKDIAKSDFIQAFLRMYARANFFYRGEISLESKVSLFLFNFEHSFIWKYFSQR